LRFDGSSTDDLNRLVDRGSPFDIELAMRVNASGTVLARATSAGPNGELDHAVLLVPRSPTTTDTQPPTITIGTPADAASYPVGSVQAAAYTCSDNIAVATCAGAVPTGSPLPTDAPGPHSFTVAATDSSGLSATSTVSYQVTTQIADGLGLTGSFTSIPPDSRCR